MLVKDKLLKEKELAGLDWGRDPEQVEYSCLYEQRPKLLRLAFERGKEKLSAEVEAFRRENAWVENYALYMALKAHFDMLPWTEWPEEEIRLRRGDAVRRWTERLRGEIDYYIFVQFLFFRQWNRLREYAHKKGVKFIGDIPIYVALDSADVWSEPQFFQLDRDNVPKAVAGVPPDAFTADGQLWGVIRIDHFRGFESYWAVPYGETTARNGVWRKGPGMKLVGVLTQWFCDLDFIAEDLGYITPEVRKLVEDSGLPGMKIMEFSFDAHGDSDYLPHNCPATLPPATCISPKTRAGAGA